MAHDPFTSANSGAKVTDYDGNLLLLTPTEYIPVTPTKYGDTDAVDADMVVLDGPTGAENIGSVRVFQGKLIGALKPRIGKEQDMVLGRLGTEPNKKDPNGKPTWILRPPTDEDKQAAREYLNSRVPANPFS